MVAFLVAAAMGTGWFGVQDSETKRQILTKLASQRISLRFEGRPLEEVLVYLRDCTGINLVVHPSVQAREVRITIRVKDLRLGSALRLLLGQRKLTAVYREGVLVIVPADAVKRRVVTRIYDCRDLLIRIRDFPGPKIELAGKGQAGIDIPRIDEEPKSRVDEGFLTEIIQANTGGDSWSADARVSVTLLGGLLVVAQSPKNHREIETLLNLLRGMK